MSKNWCQTPLNYGNWALCLRKGNGWNSNMVNVHIQKSLICSERLHQSVYREMEFRKIESLQMDVVKRWCMNVWSHGVPIQWWMGSQYSHTFVACFMRYGTEQNILNNFLQNLHFPWHWWTRTWMDVFFFFFCLQNQ